METLQGIDQICEFCRSLNIQYSENTILAKIKNDGFPARKLGGRWTAEKSDIIAWKSGRGNSDIRKIVRDEVQKVLPEILVKMQKPPKNHPKRG